MSVSTRVDDLSPPVSLLCPTKTTSGKSPRLPRLHSRRMLSISMPDPISRFATALLASTISVACVAPAGDAEPTGDETAAIEADNTFEPDTEEPSHGTYYDCTEWIPVPAVVRGGRMAAICNAWVIVPGGR